MDLAADFSFQPLPPIEPAVAEPAAEVAAAAPAASPLGLLAPLAGKWAGRGLNVIWRPNHTPGQDRFLELNLTSEQIEFKAVPGAIPNRGFRSSGAGLTGITQAMVNNPAA
jgi:hypothetical protein